MSPRKRFPPLPRYQGDARPPQLLTADELRALGLKPTGTNPEAIWLYQKGSVSGMCALYDRTHAVPLPTEDTGREPAERTER
ncbi:hypothetical protein LAJ19_17640 (plasmid) [Deinococcus taeanensis]|uniref:hypothetical protein n=1 Tax=Deinococcus taeanensis TaxID=2737050 RepID=UPI001CDD80AD|nr:hypothetical protein [Deinococcus taeanensis]UBV44595.1 hypothetical protein LAJ19_17640 [Deinococcus taeanensis]